LDNERASRVLSIVQVELTTILWKAKVGI
jgi:hypothetical protein